MEEETLLAHYRSTPFGECRLVIGGPQLTTMAANNGPNYLRHTTSTGQRPNKEAGDLFQRVEQRATAGQWPCSSI